MGLLSSPGNASEVATRRPGDVEEHSDDKMAFRADEGVDPFRIRSAGLSALRRSPPGQGTRQRVDEEDDDKACEEEEERVLCPENG